MKFEIEFKDKCDLEQFKEFLEIQYMERRLEAYKYGIGADSTLKNVILSILQQLEAQED